MEHRKKLESLIEGVLVWASVVAQEEPGGSTGSQRVRDNKATKQQHPGLAFGLLNSLQKKIKYNPKLQKTKHCALYFCSQTL